MSKNKDEPKLTVVDEGADASPKKKHKSYAGRTFETKLVELKVAGQDDLEDLEWGEETKRKRLPLGWVFLALFLLVAAVGVSLLLIRSKADANAGADTKDVKEELNETEKEVNALQNLAIRYFAASTIEEKLELVRSPERVKPLMQNWYQRNKMEMYNISSISSMSAMEFGAKQFWVIVASDGNTQLPLLIEKVTAGEFKIDWETQVAYSDMDWDYFYENKVEEAQVFRVYVQKDFYYLHEYADEKTWDCFRLIHPKSNVHLFGFIKKGTFLSKQAQGMVNKGTVRPLVLKLRFPKDYKATQAVEIVEIVSGNWLNIN